MRPHWINHILTTNKPAYLTNSTFIVFIIISLRLEQIAFTVSEDECYKGLLSMNNILRACHFFFFHFHHTLFRELAGAYMNPGRFSLFVHSLVCPITHSFLDGFQPNLVQHFPRVCSTCHTVFSLKNTLERLLHCRLIFSITWTPDK